MKAETVGHMMTGILCACAIAVAAMLVRQQFFAPPLAGAGEVQRTIENWKDFQQGQVLGKRGGRISLVVFSDYRCPACRGFSPIVDSLLARYPNQLSVYYRNLPGPSHQFARPAAFAAECAGSQGRFKEAHALLFSSPDSIGTRPWSSFAARIGLAKPADFEACVRDSLPAATVQRDEADAQRLGLRVTPTLLVDDQLINGARTLNNMDAMIRKRLAK